jgi:hypothetical protein
MHHGLKRQSERDLGIRSEGRECNRERYEERLKGEGRDGKVECTGG